VGCGIGLHRRTGPCLKFLTRSNSALLSVRYWARRQRRASTELFVSTVCTMTSSGQAAHSISQTLTKTLAFHSSRFSFRRPPVFVFVRRVERACSTWRFKCQHEANPREHRQGTASPSPARRFLVRRPFEVDEGRDCAPFSAQNDFLVSSSLISRACSLVSPIAGRPSSNLAGARACLSQTIQPVDPFLTR
jgi:hypothetical protein